MRQASRTQGITGSVTADSEEEAVEKIYEILEDDDAWDSDNPTLYFFGRDE